MSIYGPPSPPPPRAPRPAPVERRALGPRKRAALGLLLGVLVLLLVGLLVLLRDELQRPEEPPRLPGIPRFQLADRLDEPAPVIEAPRREPLQSAEILPPSPRSGTSAPLTPAQQGAQRAEPLAEPPARLQSAGVLR